MHEDLGTLEYESEPDGDEALIEFGITSSAPPELFTAIAQVDKADEIMVSGLNARFRDANEWLKENDFEPVFEYDMEDRFSTIRAPQVDPAGVILGQAGIERPFTRYDVGTFILSMEEKTEEEAMEEAGVVKYNDALVGVQIRVDSRASKEDLKDLHKLLGHIFLDVTESVVREYEKMKEGSANEYEYDISPLMIQDSREAQDTHLYERNRDMDPPDEMDLPEDFDADEE